MNFGQMDIGPYYWVGHSKNGIDYYAGQTFTSPASGILKKIKIYTSIVYGTSDATLTIYNFNSENHTWTEKEGEAVKKITKSLESQWVEFELPPIHVLKNGQYGFKIECAGNGMIAIAECPWSTKNPYKEGVEWVGSSLYKEGRFQEDFDFAFGAEIETSPDAKFI